MGVGFIEICIIALFIFIFFGPQRLPEIMREFGKFFVHAKRLSNEVKDHFETILNEAESSIIEDEKRKETQKKLDPQLVPPKSEPQIQEQGDTTTKN